MEVERVNFAHTPAGQPGSIILEPVGWVEEAARIVLETQPDREPACRFEATSPLDLRRAAIGRPAEELPRILPALSAVSAVAHHIASARALDQVFQVQPPPGGEATRQALMAADSARQHLKRLAILLTAPGSPVRREASRYTGWGVPQAPLPPAFPQELLRGSALAQEIVQMVGGRAGMPVVAVAGGTAHGLKEQDRPRFASACEALLRLAQRAGEVLGKTVFTASPWLEFFNGEPFCLPLPFIGLDGESIVISRGDGSETALVSKPFSPEQAFDQVGEQVVPGKLRVFAFRKEVAWPGLEDETSPAFFQTGPLAQLHLRQYVGQSAIQEKQRLSEQLGSPPWNSAAASLWASLVELLEACERLVELSQKDEIVSLPRHTLPAAETQSGIGASAVEGPAGLVVHAYHTGQNALIQEARVLDPSTINHAARNLACQKVSRFLFDTGRTEQGELRLIEFAAAIY